MAYETYFFLALILFLASFTQGMTGFGFAMISVPLISLLIDVKYAIPIAAICGFFVNIYLIYKLKSHIKYFELKELIFGAIIGIPLGTIFVIYSDRGILKVILALIVLLFVFLSITKIIKQTGLNKKWGYLFGLLSGFLGGAFNTNGPPVLIYFYLHGFDKFKQKASITGFFIVASAIIITAHLLTGLSNVSVWKDALIMSPIVLSGIIIGHNLFNRISTKIYNNIILAGLFIIAIILLIG